MFSKSRIFILLACALPLFLSACASNLKTRNSWPLELRSWPLEHVLVQKDLGMNSEGSGSGVILHSSKEHGTIILTCGHLACYCPELLREGSVEEFQGEIGNEFSCAAGTKFRVSVHANSVPGRAPWREWREFEGEALYGKYIVEEWPFTDYEASTIDSFRAPTVFDAALVRVRTGAEPLHTATLATAAPEVPSLGSVAGVSYNSNRPYMRNVVIAKDGIFFKDGEYCSGSGLYDNKGRLSGLYYSRIEVDGWIAVDDDRFRISHQNHYVPMPRIRRELTAEGFGWVFAR